MKFKIDDFIIYLEKKKEILDENDLIAKPKKLSYSQSKIELYELVPRTREFTVFSHLSFLEKEDGKYYSVISDLFVFIDLVEVLKACSAKKLQQEKEYSFSDKFTAKITQKDKNIYLKIHFKNYSNSLYLDKFECSSLAAKFSKILQKCEPWQESEV